MKFRAALIAVLSGITSYASAISMPISDSAFVDELNNIQQLVARPAASPQVDPVMLDKIGERDGVADLPEQKRRGDIGRLFGGALETPTELKAA